MDINYEALEQLSISDLVSLREYLLYRIRTSSNSDQSEEIAIKVHYLHIQLETKINNLFII